MNELSVHPLPFKDIGLEIYDLAIGACGFESRSRYCFQNANVISNIKTATAYSHRYDVAFPANQAWFESSGFDVVIESDEDFALRIMTLIRNASETEKAFRMLIDISSFTRARLAALLETVWNNRQGTVSINFIYALAKYYDSPKDVPIKNVGPVSPLFAGWTDAPELPTTAVFGLGFEPGKVLGAAEFLESSDIFAFIPDGPDPRFKQAVLKSNKALVDEIETDRLVNYDVANPFDTFVWIEGMCASILRRSRLILIPFGPKIFALNCMLVALLHTPRIMVLRVSGYSEDDKDVHAAGPIYSIRADFNVRKTDASEI